MARTYRCRKPKALVSVIATGEKKMQVPVNELNSQGLELKNKDIISFLVEPEKRI